VSPVRSFDASCRYIRHALLRDPTALTCHDAVGAAPADLGCTRALPTGKYEGSLSKAVRLERVRPATTSRKSPYLTSTVRAFPPGAGRQVARVPLSHLISDRLRAAPGRQIIHLRICSITCCGGNPGVRATTTERSRRNACPRNTLTYFGRWHRTRANYEGSLDARLFGLKQLDIRTRKSEIEPA
jgi:hypothetical protein